MKNTNFNENGYTMVGLLLTLFVGAIITLGSFWGYGFINDNKSDGLEKQTMDSFMKDAEEASESTNNSSNRIDNEFQNN